MKGYTDTIWFKALVLRALLFLVKRYSDCPHKLDCDIQEGIDYPERLS